MDSQLFFNFFGVLSKTPKEQWFTLSSGERVPLVFSKNDRARHYLIHVGSNKGVKVTIPRYGTSSAAQQFLEQKRKWVEKRWQRLSELPILSDEWKIGDHILFGGVEEEILQESDGTLRLGFLSLDQIGQHRSVRQAIELSLLQHARKHLPLRTWDLARTHGCTIRSVSVRNQKTRWGSCSRTGKISLNWRLIQMPPAVSDYIILHELMHLREMNHSSRYWNHVAQVCPDYLQHEAWIKAHAARLAMAG